MSAKHSKTLSLFKQYHQILKEQGEQQPDPSQEQQFDTTGGQSPDINDNPAPEPPEDMPMTSEGENQYISDLIDAALFSPSAEDSKTLQNLQSVMKLKRFTNAREEVLPTILNIIRPETDANNVRTSLDKIQ
jgi:hypothetical protein